MANQEFCEVCEQEFQQVKRKKDDRKAPLFGWNDRDSPVPGPFCWEHWNPEKAQQDSYMHYIQRSRNNLQNASLQDVNLRGAHLEAATLEKANFNGADLTDAHLEGVEISGEFHRTKAFNATFISAKLEGACLSRMNLWSCDFTGACLSKADLRGADLRWANFKNADMRWALLQAANLSNVVLDGANMQGVRMWRYTLWFMLFDCILWWLPKCSCHLGNSLFPWGIADWLGRLMRQFDLKHGEQKQVGEQEAADLKKLERSFRFACARFFDAATRRSFETPQGDRPEPWIPVTMWRAASGIDSCRTQDSLMTRYIKDVGYIQEFQLQQPCWAFLWRRSCFYGQSIILWALWCFFFTFIFGLIYSSGTLVALSASDMQSLTCGNPITAELPSWLTPYYFSIVTFTTLGFGDVRPLNIWGEFVVMLEVIAGYIALGLLISILADKVARRA